MIRVSVEVRTGCTCFQVGIQAESVARSLEIADVLYPDADVRALFPVDLEDSAVRESGVVTGISSGIVVA